MLTSVHDFGLCRGDNTGRGLTRVDSLALKANAASVARMHDTGRTMDPRRDISHHYRPHRGYSGSYHGGNIYNTMGDSMHSQESGGSGKAKKSGRKGMPRNHSTPGLARAGSTGGGGSQRGPQVLLFALWLDYHTVISIYRLCIRSSDHFAKAHSRHQKCHLHVSCHGCMRVEQAALWNRLLRSTVLLLQPLAQHA